MTLLHSLEINPHKAPIGSVIWLHGLGASGHDFADIMPHLALPMDLPLRFIFPHAPNRAITINQGYTMPAWYDITGFDLASKEDAEGLKKSEQQIQALIEHEIERGVPVSSIFLAGFSQGGATALFTGLRYHHALKGILSLSGYCPMMHELSNTRSKENAATPIWVGHGAHDDVVPFQWGNATQTLLSGWNYPVTWQTYPIAHSVCLEELQDIGSWISARFR